MSFLKAPFVKQKGFSPMPVVRGGIPKYADSRLNKKVIGTAAWEEYWNEQLHYCHNGFQTGGLYLPGRFYYYLNFNSMATGDGIITPDFVDLHLELAYLIEYCKATGKNIICAKKRRAGISEATHKMVVDYGWRFFHGYQAGVAAGQDIYAQDFMKKWRSSDSLIVPEFRTKKLLNNDDEVIAGYEVKNEDGANEEGTKNTIYVRTMFKNPNLFKGLYLNDVVAEEAGEFEKLKEFYRATMACTKIGSKIIGNFYIYGTGGQIDKGSKDFKEMWYEPDTYNCEKFLILGGRFHPPYYGGCSYDKPKTPNLLAKHKLYEITGMEDVEAAVADLKKERELLSKGSDRKGYLEHLQNYPLEEKDIFKKTSVNNFDIEKLNEQEHNIMSSPKKWSKWKLEWVKDDNGLIKSPRQVVATPAKPEDSSPEIFLILDEGHPRKTHSNLYVAGCLLPGEKVMTDSGLMNIEDVDFNNKLINKDGENVKINELQRYLLEDESVYEIKVSNTLRTTKFTSEHPIYVSKGTLKQFYKKHDPEIEFNSSYWQFDGFNFKTVDKVNAGEWIKVPNVYNSVNDFDIDDLWEDVGRVDFLIDSPLKNPDFWWFIGLWLGDGWVGKISRKNGVHISFNKKEHFYIKRFEDVVKNIFKRSVSKRERRGCVEAYFNSVQLCSFLNKHFGKYAHGKKLPEWAKKINKECKAELLRGYLNSDGCIGIDKKRNLYNAQFISINQELLEGFQDVLFSLGLISNMCLLRKEKEHLFKGRKSASRVKDCYQLRMSHYSTLDFVGLLNKNIDDHKVNRIDFSDIKKTKRRPNDGCFVDKTGNYIYFQIREIKVSKYTGIVYNFDCDTHTYMCKHITTHNCDSYDQDVAKTSKSLGAMCVLMRNNNIMGAPQKAPVAVICTRPPRKEIFYDMCLRLAVYYNIKNNVLVDVAKPQIIKYFEERSCLGYLAPRPRKFESPNSEQSHAYGVSLNIYSRPMMVALMESAVYYNVDQIWFNHTEEYPNGVKIQCDLINQLGNFDETEVGSDNDLADAYGIALVQDVSCDLRVEDETTRNLDDIFNVHDGYFDDFGNFHQGGKPTELKSDEQDHDRFGLS